MSYKPSQRMLSGSRRRSKKRWTSLPKQRMLAVSAGASTSGRRMTSRGSMRSPLCHAVIYGGSLTNKCRAWPWRCSMNELVEQVNKLLLAGEPGNITKADTNGYVGYEPQAIIDSMNEGFGIGSWGFEELSSETVDNEKGTLAVAQVRVWLKDIDFKPFAWGQSRVTRGDTGDAKKGAQTDAIKKALAYFSIGNRAYHGLLEKSGIRPTTTQKPPKQD